MPFEGKENTSNKKTSVKKSSKIKDKTKSNKDKSTSNEDRLIKSISLNKETDKDVITLINALEDKGIAFTYYIKQLILEDNLRKKGLSDLHKQEVIALIYKILVEENLLGKNNNQLYVSDINENQDFNKKEEKEMSETNNNAMNNNSAFDISDIMNNVTS